MRQLISASTVKKPHDLKNEAQDMSCVIQSGEGGDKNETVSVLNGVSIFEQLTADKMTEEQQNDPIKEAVSMLQLVKKLKLQPL